MTNTITRRALGGLALGAVSAGALRAQDAYDDPCRISREWGNWEAIVALYESVDADYYTFDMRHKASEITFRLESTDPDRVMGARMSVFGFSKIYNDVEWFLQDVTDNGGRSLEVTLTDPATGFYWEVRGRATREADAFSDWEPYGAVRLDISEQKVRQLYDYMSRNETQVSAEAKLILDDGSRHVASTWKMTTNGLGVVNSWSGEMFPELTASLQPGACAGACFVTTACCEEFGRPDDGVELTTLRGFRDNWLIRQPGGAEDVALYYRLAPRICAAIAAHPRGRWELARVYATGILPCVALIKLGLFRAARGLYQRQIMRLQARYQVSLA